METAIGFMLAIIFGGMITFQFLFAPLLFTKLEQQIARKFIRAFFPFYYLYFGFLTLIACIISFVGSFALAGVLMFLCFIGFVVSRQILMPKANQATDSGNTADFKKFHLATIVINTLQLFIVAYLLFRAL